jgi:phosphoglycerate kinase
MFAHASASFLRQTARRATTTAPSNLTTRYFHLSPAALEKLNVQGLADRVNLEGQNVLMRVDLNVPLSKGDDVTVTDDTRLRAIVPTAKFLLDKGDNLPRPFRVVKHKG